MIRIIQFLQSTVWAVALFILARMLFDETFLSTPHSPPQRNLIVGGFLVLWLIYGSFIFANVAVNLAQGKEPPPDDD